MKKAFIITIDTEGDNIWNHKIGDSIETKNVEWLKRFQLLCEKHCFKPTYLVNFEMVSNKDFVFYFKKKQDANKCEIGMHLHAWNSPPLVDLVKRNDGIEAGLPYITEYENNVIEKKVKYLTQRIENEFGIKPVSHRSGRWATNELYAKILEKYGYKFDCSFTPGISWHKCPGYTDGSFGSDYSKSRNGISSFYNTSILEIPFPGYKDHRIKKERIVSFRTWFRNVVYAIKRKQIINLRPDGKNSSDLFYILRKNSRAKQKYIMFMIHSSELMPGGSSTFKTIEDIENLFEILEKLFSKIENKHFIGMTLKEFGAMYNTKC